MKTKTETELFNLLLKTNTENSIKLVGSLVEEYNDIFTLP